MSFLDPNAWLTHKEQPEQGGRFDWPNETLVKQNPYVIGMEAEMVLDRNALRAGYRVIAQKWNTDPVYHGYNNQVSKLSPDVINPAMVLEDVGEWQTVHQGEVWLIADRADMDVMVEEIVVSPEWFYAHLRGGWW